MKLRQDWVKLLKRKGRRSNIREIVNWVFESMGQDDNQINWKKAPSLGAINLLKHVRCDGGSEEDKQERAKWFFQVVWIKALGKDEKEKASWQDDGRLLGVMDAYGKEMKIDQIKIGRKAKEPSNGATSPASSGTQMGSGTKEQKPNVEVELVQGGGPVENSG